MAMPLLGVKKISKFKFLIKLIIGIRIKQFSAFCGQGVSLNSNIGTWNEFAKKSIELTEIYISKNKVKTSFNGDHLRSILSEDFCTVLKVLNDCEAVVNKKLLLQLLSEHLSFKEQNGDATINLKHNVIHEQLANLPVLSVWTTNIDQFIEEAYISLGKQIIVMDRSSVISKHHHVYNYEMPDNAMPIYKYHGTCNRVVKKGELPQVSHEVVLTGKDYQKFENKKPLLNNHFAVALKYTSMLFMGYDFPEQDNHILKCIEEVSKNSIRHLAIMTKPQFNQCKERIKKLNIDVCIVKNWDEVEQLLYMTNKYGKMFWS